MDKTPLPTDPGPALGCQDGPSWADGRGHYAGTRSKGCSPCVWLLSGWRSRGGAAIWLSPESVCVRKHRKKRTLAIRYSAIRRVLVGNPWFRGSPLPSPVILVEWKHGRSTLYTGLCVPGDTATARAWAKEILARAQIPGNNTPAKQAPEARRGEETR